MAKPSEVQPKVVLIGEGVPPMVVIGKDDEGAWVALPEIGQTVPVAYLPWSLIDPLQAVSA